MVYLTAKAANEIKEFRYRLQGDRVAVYETIHPSYTIIHDDEIFSFCGVNYEEDFLLFAKNIKEKIDGAKNSKSLNMTLKLIM